MKCGARLIVDTNCDHTSTPTVLECELEEHVGALHQVSGQNDNEYDFIVTFAKKAE